MTSWWLLVRPCNPCLLCEEVDLSNVAKSPVKRIHIQNKEALWHCAYFCASTITYNECRHGYMHVCMHMETPRAFKRVRQNSIHYHTSTKLDVRKRIATNCANFTLSACRLRFDSAWSSVWQLGLFQCLMSWKKMGAIKMTQTAHGKTVSGSAMSIWARVVQVVKQHCHMPARYPPILQVFPWLRRCLSDITIGKLLQFCLCTKDIVAEHKRASPAPTL